MRLAFCSLLLCSTTALLGQSQTQPQNSIPAFVSPSTLYLSVLSGMSCPIGMKAARQPSAQQEWTVSLEDALEPLRPDTRTNKAGVHVELVGFRSKLMKQAEVMVYYTAPGPRVLPASGYSADTTAQMFELTKTFVLSAANGEPNVGLTGSLLVGNAANITRVRLLRLEYANGSTWQAKNASDCTVDPALFMAVAGR